MSEFYTELRNSSRDRADRYKDCKILEDTSTGETLLANREIKDIPYNTSDTYHRVQSNEVCRFDILAHKYYKNPLLWWVIAQANDIYNPFEDIPPGTLLRIPCMETLYGNNGILL